MSTNNSADFTSLFNIQKQYVVDLGAITNKNVATGTYYTDVKNKLDNLYTVYGNAMPASSAALENQQQIYNIIQAEKDRLDKKQSGINNAYFTQQRLLQLNESYREKNMKYITILIIIIIAIVIYLALLMVNRHLPFVPKFLINLLTALLIGFTVIIIVVIYVRINKRDNMDFQKLLFVPPKTYGNVYGNVDGNSVAYGISACANNFCCGEGTTWDPNSSQCVLSTTSGFTLMNSGNNNCGKCNVQEIPYIPYTPLASFEFAQYT